MLSVLTKIGIRRMLMQGVIVAVICDAGIGIGAWLSRESLH